MPRGIEINEKLRTQSLERIIESSTRLFAEKGFFLCKMSDIAKAADMSVGNLYWYFKSKNQVLAAVLQSGFEAQKAALDALPRTDAGPREKLDSFIEAYYASCIKQYDFFLILLNLIATGKRQFLKDLGFNTFELGAGYHASLLGLVSGINKNGVHEEELKILPTIFFSFFLGLMAAYGEDLKNIPLEFIKKAAQRLLVIQ